MATKGRNLAVLGLGLRLELGLGTHPEFVADWACQAVGLALPVVG